MRIPELDDFEDDEIDENSSVAGARKLIYLQKNEVTGSDIATAPFQHAPGNSGSGRGSAASWFTRGWTYYGVLLASPWGASVWHFLVVANYESPMAFLTS